MKNVDRTLVINYWTKMLREFNAKVKPKNKSWMMNAMGRILERRGVMSRKKFAGMATTIGRTVYLSYKLGTEQEGWGLQQQLANCVHEMVHVHQAGNRPYRFYWRYLTSTKHRVQYEKEAYGGSVMAYHVITGGYADPAAIAGKLKSYQCSEADRLRAQRYYTAINRALREGRFVGHPAANRCCRELKEMMR